MRFLETPSRRITRSLDALFNRVFDWRWNPMHQSGVLAAWLLLVLTVTGLYLLLLYRVGDPSGSVRRIADQVWLGAWVRTLHRYATDAFVIAAVLHAVRLLGQARQWGARARAWITGVFLLGVGLVCAWTGFVMAWDAFGLRLAIAGARVLDVLPILSEPVGRIFSGEHPIPSAFFFLNLFIHIALPLAMGAGLWLHVSKVARPALAPPRGLRWGVVGFLTILSIIKPAVLDPAADPFLLPQSTSVDLATTWWLPLVERSSPLTTLLVSIAALTLALAIPRLSRRRRDGAARASVVDPRLCTGCDQCPHDCPWEAITMVQRQDDRKSLVAQVDPARCVSCGICAGSCAPMGIGPPGRSGRDQLAVIRGWNLPARSAAEAEDIVVVFCEQAPESLRRSLSAAGARMHGVPCVGALHSSVVELLLRQGVSGVLVGGCPPRDCAGREGPKWLEQRFHHEREAELQARVDRRRVRITTFAPGLDSAVLAEFEAYRRELAAMELDIAEPSDLLELLCDRPVEAESAL